MGKKIKLLFLIVLLLISGCILQNREYEKPIIKSGIAALFPEPQQLGSQWQLQYVQQKNISNWSEDDRKRAETDGFLEGYVVNYVQDNTNLLTVSISAYEKMNKDEVYARHLKEAKKKERYFQGRQEKLSLMKDITIGDISVMNVVTIEKDLEQEEQPIFTYYELMFTKYNIIVQMRCAFQMNNAAEECIRYGKMVEERIMQFADLYSELEKNKEKYLQNDSYFEEAIFFGPYLVKIKKYNPEEILNTSKSFFLAITKHLKTGETEFEENLSVGTAVWSWNDPGRGYFVFLPEIYGGDYAIRMVDKEGDPYLEFPFHVKEDPEIWMAESMNAEDGGTMVQDFSWTFFGMQYNDFLGELIIYYQGKEIKKYTTKDFVQE